MEAPKWVGGGKIKNMWLNLLLSVFNVIFRYVKAIFSVGFLAFYFVLGKYVFSCPFFQMGKEILSNSAKDIEYEKKRMEYVLEKQKRLQV